MKVLVDTGIFSAAVSRRRRSAFDAQLRLMTGSQVFLAAVTVSELRYGALVAEWGESRRERLEQAIAATTVVPVSDTLLTRIAELRYTCRLAGHPLADRVHATTSGWPLVPSTSLHPCSRQTASSAIRPGCDYSCSPPGTGAGVQAFRREGPPGACPTTAA